MIYITQSPDELSLAGNPVAYRAYTIDSDTTKLALFAESAFGLGDWKRIYEEERTDISGGVVFDFAEVLDSILVPEMPDPALPAHASDTHCLRYFVAGPERFSGETLHASFAGVTGGSAIPVPLSAGSWYRVEVDYEEGYRKGPFSIGTQIAEYLVFSEFIFEGEEWVYGGKIVQVFEAKADYDHFNIANVLDGKTVSIYLIPMQEKYALKGAWDVRDWPGRATLLPGGRTYASPLPLSRKMLLGQYDWLWLLMQHAPGGADAYLAATIEYPDGSSTTLPPALVGTFEQYRPVAVNISDALIGWEAAGGQSPIARLRLKAYEDGHEPSAEEVVLELDYLCRPFLREFHYFNAMGGFDSLIAYGKGRRSGSVGAEVSRVYLGDGYERHPGYARTVHAARERFAVSAGYRTLAEREAAKAIFISEAAFIREGDALVPINILSSSWEDEKDGDYRHTLSFEYAYAFDNKAVRPQ